MNNLCILHHKQVIVDVMIAKIHFYEIRMLANDPLSVSLFCLFFIVGILHQFQD